MYTVDSTGGRRLDTEEESRIKSLKRQLFAARQNVWAIKLQLEEMGLHRIAADVKHSFDYIRKADIWFTQDRG